MRTIEDVVQKLAKSNLFSRLPKPKYNYRDNFIRVALAVEEMSRHTSDEGWQLMLALKESGYSLWGKNCECPITDVREILSRFDPGTIVVQDKREWMGMTADRRRDESRQFQNIELLKDRSDIFKLTIIKDAQHNLGFHSESAEEMGCHAWITYYNPRIICRLAPYIRSEHVIRTYHTIDSEIVPTYSATNREGILLSGAISPVYPLRTAIARQSSSIPNLRFLKHPGYHSRGSYTPEFLKTLSRYKVSICTSSNYGYLLRKIIESTACGCRVITDLPTDEIVPGIDANLIRVDQSISIPDLKEILAKSLSSYCPRTQEYFSKAAKAFYDYRVMGKSLANDIETMRKNWRTTK